MTETYPVIKTCYPNLLQPVWLREDRMLPEPIHFQGHVINPSPDIRVEAIRWSGIQRKMAEPWTVIWVTLSGPDGSLPEVTFNRSKPKFGPEDAKRPEGASVLDRDKLEEKLRERIAKMQKAEPLPPGTELNE